LKKSLKPIKDLALLAAKLKTVLSLMLGDMSVSVAEKRESMVRLSWL
jgi:hypothetical protein